MGSSGLEDGSDESKPYADYDACMEAAQTFGIESESTKSGSPTEGSPSSDGCVGMKRSRSPLEAESEETQTRVIVAYKSNREAAVDAHNAKVLYVLAQLGWPEREIPGKKVICDKHGALKIVRDRTTQEQVRATPQFLILSETDDPFALAQSRRKRISALCDTLRDVLPANTSNLTMETLLEEVIRYVRGTASFLEEGELSLTLPHLPAKDDVRSAIVTARMSDDGRAILKIACLDKGHIQADIMVLLADLKLDVVRSETAKEAGWLRLCYELKSLDGVIINMAQLERVVSSHVSSKCERMIRELEVGMQTDQTLASCWAHQDLLDDAPLEDISAEFLSFP